MSKHIPLLSVLHYVYGSFICLVGLAVFFLMNAGAFLVDEAIAHEGTDAPPDWLGAYISSFGLGLFILLCIWGVLIILSGLWMKRRRNRTGSMVIAALCLLSFPLGTAIGVFALVVLSDESVKKEYAATRLPGS